MVVSEDSPIKTLSFKVDRPAYAKVKFADILRRIWPVSFVWIGLVVAYLLTPQDQPSRLLADYSALFTFVFYICLFVILFQRIYSKANRRAFETERRFEFSESTIFVSMGDLGESRYSWKLITRMFNLMGWTFLMQSSIVAAAVPDTAFVSGEDLQAFRHLVSRRTDDIRAKRN